jgi:hypothetical protein
MTPVVIAACTVIGLLLTIALSWCSPPAKRWRAERVLMRRAIVGCEEVRDRSGAIIQPAQPSIIAKLDGLQPLTELGDVMPALRHIVAEFPKNGVPARAVIDALRLEVAGARSDINAIAADRELWKSHLVNDLGFTPPAHHDRS